jgi:precorrin-6A/cobalt-precorrin-6A reductase
LILAGTSEAMQLGERLHGNADYAPLMSFAGRTRALRPPPTPHRVGGFGGWQGLAAFLTQGGYRAVVDATHPFAARMSDNARRACAANHVPLAVLTRPPWQSEAGDSWVDVADMTAAAAALGETPRTVFLTIGRQELAAFRPAIAHRYIARAVDAPDTDALPPGAKVITARGPFALEDELRLMRDHKVDVVVAKNSGGHAAYAKVVAARQLGLPVIMVRRPRGPGADDLHDLDAVLAWLDAERRRQSDHGSPPEGVL